MGMYTYICMYIEKYLEIPEAAEDGARLPEGVAVVFARVARQPTSAALSD